MKEISKKFVDDFGTTIGPLMHKYCSKSKNYPNYRGLTVDRNFPISKKGDEVYYTFTIDNKFARNWWDSDSIHTIAIFFFPLSNTNKIYFRWGGVYLKSNLKTFFYKQVRKILEKVAAENGWMLCELKKNDGIKILPEILSTIESDKLIENHSS